jgi:2-oxo-4-hydroxy-4-carboxy-5-ureidoimidazoline decarboxylase
MASRNEALSREAFVARYGGIYEHSPWVAEQCFDEASEAGTNVLVKLFASCVDAADHDAKIRLIRAHPDLAGRAAVRGELTAESTGEQASAGIDQCTKEEFEQFVALNSAYKDKFGFPFIMAVKNSNRHDILAAFRTRIENDADSEFATAMREIHKIARWRLEAL